MPHVAEPLAACARFHYRPAAARVRRAVHPFGRTRAGTRAGGRERERRRARRTTTDTSR